MCSFLYFLLIVAWWNMMQKASQSLLCCWCGKIFASLFTVSNFLPQAQMSILLKIQVQKGKSTITGNNLKVLAIFTQCLMYFWCDHGALKTQSPDRTWRKREDPLSWGVLLALQSTKSVRGRCAGNLIQD